MFMYNVHIHCVYVHMYIVYVLYMYSVYTCMYRFIITCNFASKASSLSLLDTIEARVYLHIKAKW